jgi:hypothetical protein
MKPNPPPAAGDVLQRRRHELADRVEHNLELRVVLLLQRIERAGPMGGLREPPGLVIDSWPYINNDVVSSWTSR